MKWMIFDFYIRDCRPETGQCGPLMYINEMCSMVVFWSWFIIGLNRNQSDIRNCWCTPQSDVWFCLKPKSTLGRSLACLAAVNLLAWSKVFHVKFYLNLNAALMESEHCHVDNQSGSLFTCLFLVVGWRFPREDKRIGKIWLFGAPGGLGEVWLFYIITGYPG